MSPPRSPALAAGADLARGPEQRDGCGGLADSGELDAGDLASRTSRARRRRRPGRRHTRLPPNSTRTPSATSSSSEPASGSTAATAPRSTALRARARIDQGASASGDADHRHGRAGDLRARGPDDRPSLTSSTGTPAARSATATTAPRARALSVGRRGPSASSTGKHSGRVITSGRGQRHLPNCQVPRDRSRVGQVHALPSASQSRWQENLCGVRRREREDAGAPHLGAARPRAVRAVRRLLREQISVRRLRGQQA